MRQGGFFNDAIPILEAGSRTGKSTTDPRAGMGIGQPGDPMFTLQSGKQHAVAFEASHFTRGKDGAPSEVVPPLSADADKGDQDTLIAFSSKDHGADAGEISPTLRSMGHKDSHMNGGGQVAVAYRTAGNCGPFDQGDKTGALNTATDPNQNTVLTHGVRRLTPTECERLQGFPDQWTAGFSDSSRYKMAGNAVAVPVVEFLARNISRSLYI